MLCSKCLEKPTGKEVKLVLCYHCNSVKTINQGYADLMCNDCSSKLSICQSCGVGICKK